MLSAVIITFNEEKNIERCIRSLQAVADEVVVVDSLSTDKTRTICESMGARVIEEPFRGHVEQKNYALSLARYPYVLSLDADEALSNELIASILVEKKAGFQTEGYAMNRLNRYCGKWIRHGLYYPDRKLRLVKKEFATWKGINPHDKLELSKGAIKKLRGDILHHAYDSYEQHLEKANRYSSIAAKAKIGNKQRASFLNLVVNPAWAFLNGYILRAGFLDGKEGFVIARMIAFETYLKYSKMLKLQKGKEL